MCFQPTRQPSLKCTSRTKGTQMDAYIINGDRHGNVNEPRWSSALALCKDLNLNCKRSKAVYPQMQEYTKVCPHHKPADRLEAYQRGVAVAHHDVLQKIADSGRDAFVFEDDVGYPARAQAKDVLAETQKTLNGTKAGFYNLGPCGKRASTSAACTHYLYVTPAAAKQALRKVNWCGGSPVDVQVRHLCERGDLQCSRSQKQILRQDNRKHPRIR